MDAGITACACPDESHVVAVLQSVVAVLVIHSHRNQHGSLHGFQPGKALPQDPQQILNRRPIGERLGGRVVKLLAKIGAAVVIIQVDVAAGDDLPRMAAIQPDDGLFRAGELAATGIGQLPLSPDGRAGRQGPRLAHLPGPLDLYVGAGGDGRKGFRLDRSAGELVNAVLKDRRGDFRPRFELGREEDRFREVQGGLVADHLNVGLGVGWNGQAADK